MLPKNREPTSPGEMLLEEFLKPLEMTQGELAKKMGYSNPQTVNLIVNGKRGITAETALRLAKVFDVSAQYWMNLQASFDLWHAERKLAAAR